ncbi:MAG: hypothetical protein SFV22_15780 [Saprospiraceae bacterium]|nr:hypothetical protein [Saprospiraceae bacterium]
MRNLLTGMLVWASLGVVKAQFVCFSDSTAIYEFPGIHLPPMVGEAVFYSGQYKVIVGGKFLDLADPAAEAVYNCDMLVLDQKVQKTYVLPLSYFPPFVADQFAGVNYGFTTDRDTAYVLGGYGYDLVTGNETTFPTLTFFPLKTLIDSVVQGKDYLALFSVIESDRRLAITEGTLVKIGTSFLVYNGREILPIEEEFSDQPMVNEWDFRGQLRKFTLKNTDGYQEVGEFQVCSTSRVFYQCMPVPNPKKN